MALTEYIFNLSCFHIGQLAPKAQNLQRLWCVHAFKKKKMNSSSLIAAEVLHVLMYTVAVPNSHYEITDKTVAYDYAI